MTWLLCFIIAIIFPLPGTLLLFIFFITPIWMLMALCCGGEDTKKTKWRNFAEWERDHLKNLDREKS